MEVDYSEEEKEHHHPVTDEPISKEDYSEEEKEYFHPVTDQPISKKNYELAVKGLPPAYKDYEFDI